MLVSTKAVLECILVSNTRHASVLTASREHQTTVLHLLWLVPYDWPFSR